MTPDQVTVEWFDATVSVWRPVDLTPGGTAPSGYLGTDDGRTSRSPAPYRPGHPPPPGGSASPFGSASVSAAPSASLTSVAPAHASR
ncbi:hypothetical protein ACIHCM_09820 [Streptomyces sp. NPDC052023]|uniref:hypothetical protein n=1 Tax=Streptomyces sp. NPDC052023 TaxID=3365681 RepID=UPI0037D46D11